MKPRHFRIIGTLSAFTMAAALNFSPGALALSPAAETVQDLEILTRGPVHEAFAESVSFEPVAGLIVRVAPPEPIEELPPEQQPEGDNVTWIPGYWAWDDDRGDFLWISGIWRNLPPERQWVPGYWDDLGNGEYQWTSGYWADAETTETAYIPAPPPRSVDVGPNIAAPSADHTWIPGNWIWTETRYVWRPGYWNVLRPNWTWVPSRYCWTRRGYVYVDGYWDYAVARRGVIFAPVYFSRRVYVEPAYYYTPSIVVSLDVFSAHLFIRPRCGHYYFGDYYAPRYRDSGFYASFHWHSGGRGYDPIFAYNRWDHRHDHHWVRQCEENYVFFRDNDRYRPPHTWSAMERLRTEKFDDDRGRSRLFANSFAGLAKNPERGLKFRKVDQASRTEFVAKGKEMRKFSLERRKVEAKPVSAEDVSKKVVTREKINRSPVFGRNAGQLSKEQAPPERPEPRGGQFKEKREAKKAEKAGTVEESPGADREQQPGGNTREMPGRKVKPVPETREKPEPEPKVTPERKVKPEAPTREVPQREPKVTPERKVKPEAPTREVPQRKPMVTPERKVKPEAPTREVPQRKPMVVPERKVKPEPPTREVPQRKPMVTPERKVKPEPQVRETPKREIQRQPQPQRQIQPFKRDKEPGKGNKGLPDA